MRRSSYPHPTNPLPMDHLAYWTKEYERQAERVREIRLEMERELASLPALVSDEDEVGNRRVA